MARPIPHTALLTCHPESHSEAVRELAVHVSSAHSKALALTYMLKGDLTRLRIPPLQPLRRADCLWEHTCFEAFVNLKGDSRYYEFNFAPSGEWAFHAFDRYRERASTAAEQVAPTIAVRQAKDTLELDAFIHLDRLPQLRLVTPLRLGLSSVVEENDGALSYWALKHPPGKPDFHHADVFELEIDPKYRGRRKGILQCKI
jgi:hypothetical protein